MSAEPTGRLARVRLPIRTRRCELRFPSATRDRELIRLLQDPTVSRWTTIPSPYGPDQAREFRVRARRRYRDGTDLPLQIVRRRDGALIGGVGIHLISWSHDRGELGYWIGEPFRRQGFVTEAAEAVVRLAFRSLKLHRVEAHVLAGNHASERTLLRLGFRQEGYFRQSYRARGGYSDELLFARLATDRGRSASPTRTK